MKRRSVVSSDSVFDEDGISSGDNGYRDEEDCNLLTHEILLMGCTAIQSLLGLSAWLSEDKSWLCDMAIGVLRGDVVLDDTPVRVNVSSLGGEQDYCGMLDARLSSCDGLIYLVEDKLDKDTLDMLFEQIRQVKDGQLFSLVLALIGTDQSSTLYTNAMSWCSEHYGTSVVCLREDDSASLAQCVCDAAVRVHRLKESIAKLMMTTPDSSPCPSRHSGSLRSSRRPSSSSSIGCTGFKLQRSTARRKSSLSPSTTSSVTSKYSTEEKRPRSRYSSEASDSRAGQCTIM
eukprot:scpid80400/ scgid10478/ 